MLCCECLTLLRALDLDVQFLLFLGSRFSGAVGAESSLDRVRAKRNLHKLSRAKTNGLPASLMTWLD